ncbi:MAG: tRNA lysidine(34) synthetase TilS [Phycisphaerae bacterium]|nr:tRNA lysidine(34) synthetase TilS [Phycisphaerae bacterium]
MPHATRVDNTGRARPLDRRDPRVASVILQWRRLTGGGSGAPTLVACSGGADSTFLALVLASAGAPVSLGHVVHDLRPRSDSLADRDAVVELGRRLGLPVLVTEIHVRAAKGNLESAARVERYRALASLASAESLRFIATAHQAHDQLESVLMALVRGSGPSGWRAMAERRTLAGGATLVRPMLHIDPGEARRLCQAAGFGWQTDATNADTSRLRAALRARVLPPLLELRPGAARAAARWSRHAAEAQALVLQLAEALGPGPWARTDLRAASPLVVGQALRLAAARCGGGGDRLTDRAVREAVRIIRSNATDPHELTWSGVRVLITARQVAVRPADAPAR